MVPAVIHNQVEGADRSGSCQHRGDGCWLSLPPGVQPAAGGLNLSAEALGARSVKFNEGNRGAREEALPQLQTGGPGAGSQSLVAANAQGSAVGSPKTLSDTNRSRLPGAPAVRCGSPAGSFLLRPSWRACHNPGQSPGFAAASTGSKQEESGGISAGTHAASQQAHVLGLHYMRYDPYWCVFRQVAKVPAPDEDRGCALGAGDCQ